MDTEQVKYVANLKEWLIERKIDLNYSLESFDKLIVTLASGGLVLTMGFAKDIVKITTDTDITFLKACWISLTVSLATILMSQISSFWANTIEISLTNTEINEIEINGEFNDTTFKVRFKRVLFRITNSLIKGLNIFAFIALVLGISFFIIFVNENL